MPEKYMAIAWSGLPVFQMMIPTLEGAIFFYLFWVLRVLWYSSLPQRTDSIIWLRDEVMVCLCFCPITWKTIYNLVFPSLNLFSPHLPFVPEPWAFPKGTALCLLPVLKGTAQPLRAPCWVVWGGLALPHVFSGLSMHSQQDCAPKPPSHLSWNTFLHPSRSCLLLFSSQETLHPL